MHRDKQQLRDEASIALFGSDETLWPYSESVRPLMYVYLVSWPSWPVDVIKVGTTERPARWRRFVSSGATVELLARTRAGKALRLENNVLARMEDAYPYAFQSRNESTDLLPRGFGWTECFSADVTGAREIFMGEVLHGVVQG
jgi:hypothetical protein